MMLLPVEMSPLVSRFTLGISLVGKPIEARDNSKLVVANQRLAMGVADVDKMEVLAPRRQLVQVAFSAGCDVGLVVCGVLLWSVGVRDTESDVDFNTIAQQGL